LQSSLHDIKEEEDKKTTRTEPQGGKANEKKVGDRGIGRVDCEVVGKLGQAQRQKEIKTRNNTRSVMGYV
jgi:hypothetical protein